MEKKQYKHSRLEWVAEWDRVHDSYVAQGPTSQWYLPMEIVENDSEWIEQVSKVYEIVSFREVNSVRVYRKKLSGSYEWEKIVVQEEYALNNPGYYEIHSVRRMNDGEVFAIGDKVVWEWVMSVFNGEKYMTIKSFEVAESSNLVVYHTESKDAATYIDIFSYKHYQQPHKEPCTTIVIGDSGYSVLSSIAEYMNTELQKLVKEYKEGIQEKEPEQRPVVTVTEDGKDITDPYQIVYQVDDNWNKVWSHACTNPKRAFSSEEARTEYIKMTKPIVCMNDIKMAISVSNNINEVEKNILKILENRE